MSGIAGILGLDFNEATLEDMLHAIQHRGPDHAFIHAWENNALLQVNRREDTTDIQTLDWGGERYVIAFDGKIFNREELGSALMRSECPPQGNSDGEWMLRGYLCWGEEVLNRVNGVFALAISHERSKKTFLARDRMGVRPLFYMQRGEGLLLASEIKGILTHPAVEAELDAQGAGELLLLGPGRTPGSAVFKNIYELEPGQFAWYQGGNLQLRRYWSLQDQIHTDSFDETTEKVRYLVVDAICQQLPWQPRIGTMLSGGLDSSLVSAICSRALDARGEVLETFSLDYYNNALHFVPGRFQPNMDTEYIQIMLSALDSNHHWTVLAPAQLVEEIPNATIARDLPGMADIDTSLLAFCRQIAPHSKTVFSGECADEIFGGYPWYREADLRDYDGFPWAQTVRERQAFLNGWVRNSIHPDEFVRERYLHALRQADILPENDARERRIKELTNLNIRWFMQTLLERADRMGNATGIDIRVPFCDYRIAEYLYTVPWIYKDHKGMEKGLLRKAMEGILPSSVLYRKKSPFPKTYDPAYLELASKMLDMVLKQDSSPIFQLVEKEALENLLHQDFPYPWYGQLMRRPQTIVYMLQINYWLEHYSVRIV